MTTPLDAINNKLERAQSKLVEMMLWLVPSCIVAILMMFIIISMIGVNYRSINSEWRITRPDGQTIVVDAELVDGVMAYERAQRTGATVSKVK